MRPQEVLLAAAAVLCTASAGCPSDDATLTPPPAGQCRTNVDCNSALQEQCLSPLPTFDVCGVPCNPMNECVATSDCAGGDVCMPYVGGCCQTYEPRNTQCAAACTDDGQCQTGWRCSADQVGGEPIPCTDDAYTCPTHTTCNTTQAPDWPGDCGFNSCPERPEYHGCERASCSADAECDGGYCIGGACYTSFGTCRGPAA